MDVPDAVVGFASTEDAGRPCPYCRFALKQGSDVVHCPACGAVHHAECWDENQGCAVVGCAGRASGARTHGAENDVPQATSVSGTQEPLRDRAARGAAFWLALGALIVAAAAGAGVLVFVMSTRSSSSTATNSQPSASASTPAATVTVQITTPQAQAKGGGTGRAAAPSVRSAKSSVGVPAVYGGRFTAVDRLERCNATATYIYCSAGPSGKAVKLAGGAALDLGVRGSADLGGPSMPEGASFRTANGRFECGSSSRGITCRDLVSGSSFVIGDYQVSIDNRGRPSATQTSGVPARYTGYFTSVDRLERCFATNDYVVCSAGPSGKAVKLVAGGGATYQGVLGSTDRGGLAMSEGKSFTTPSGAIRCGSSSRGITCSDVSTGDGFVIGDYRVHVINAGRDVVH